MFDCLPKLPFNIFFLAYKLKLPISAVIQNLTFISDWVESHATGVPFYWIEKYRIAAQIANNPSAGCIMKNAIMMSDAPMIAARAFIVKKLFKYFKCFYVYLLSYIERKQIYNLFTYWIKQKAHLCFASCRVKSYLLSLSVS